MLDSGDQDYLLPKEIYQDRRFSADAESCPSENGFAPHRRPSMRWKRGPGVLLWLGRIFVLTAVATASFWLGTLTQGDFGQCIRRTSEYCT